MYELGLHFVQVAQFFEGIFQFLVAGLKTFIELGILDGSGGLCRRDGQQTSFLVKGIRFGVVNTQGPNGFVTDDERHDQE